MIRSAVSVVALVCALVCGCASLFPTLQRAAVIGQDALAAAAAAGFESPEASRRLSIAVAALDAVQDARDDRALLAAAPCAVAALRALEPDLKTEQLIDSLRAVASALEQVGGTCDVDKRRDDDAGVSP